MPATSEPEGDNSPMSANEAAQIRQLEIRMGVPDIGDNDCVYPVARLLIDGEDKLFSRA
jgi:hypothetical protein